MAGSPGLRRPFRALAWLLLGFLAGLLAFQRGWVPPWITARPPTHEVSSAANRSKRREVTPRTAERAALRSLPYLAFSLDPRPESGVVRHRPDAVSPGVNFFTVWSQSSALLITMEGRLLHRWSYSRDGAFWHHAELLPDGGLVVVDRDRAVLRLDADSKLIWRYETRAHHDLWVDDRGAIWALTREARRRPELNATMPILTDAILELSSGGTLLRTIPLLDVFRSSPYAFLLSDVSRTATPGTELDLLHANHVEVFDGRLAARSPLYARGNILISLKLLNAIAILDGETLAVRWLWGPNNLVLQHDPTLLDDGHLLVFDNGIHNSRVLEVDPLTDAVTWSYRLPPSYASSWGGSVQRLANGNTLITATERGRVLEVTPDGAVVWEYVNPERRDDVYRANIWRMVRFDPADLAFLSDPG